MYSRQASCIALHAYYIYTFTLVQRRYARHTESDIKNDDSRGDSVRPAVLRPDVEPDS